MSNLKNSLSAILLVTLASASVASQATVADISISSVVTKIYRSFTDVGGGTPYSDYVGSLTTPGISFATDTGYAWHPFDLSSFGADIVAQVLVASAGSYTFRLDSDDGSLLFIDGSQVIDNGGGHGPNIVDGTVSLTAGTHSLEVQFFEDYGGPSGVDLKVVPIPAAAWLFGPALAGLAGVGRRWKGLKA